MNIKNLVAYKTFNSRAEENITIKVVSSKGTIGFGSAPSGASTGRYEVKAYTKNKDSIVRYLNKNKRKFIGKKFNTFSDLNKIESMMLIKQLGGNPNLAIEYAILNCMATEKGLPLYKIINPKLKMPKIPIAFGNAIGGGAHAGGKAGDIQEILLVGSLADNAKTYHKLKSELEKKDFKFIGGKTDEGAWASTLSATDSLRIARKSTKGKIGIDLAASELFKNKKYVWRNFSSNQKSRILSKKDQMVAVISLAKRFNLYYIEDPLEENDFEGFAQIRKHLQNVLICGDDLTVTNTERLKKAIKYGSVDAVIVKPNQIGSVLKAKDFFDLAIENHIVPILSHRSGETTGTEIAHLAIAWGAPGIKCGIATGERIAKLNELIFAEK